MTGRARRAIPPDAVPFRRCAGAPHRLRPLKTWAFSRGLALHLLGELFGCRHGVGRDGPQVMIVLSRATLSCRAAAPTRATLHHARSRKQPSSTSLRQHLTLARGRTSVSSFEPANIWLN